MGTSTYSLTSNAFIEMRDLRCRREMRNRLIVFMGLVALVSVAVTQMSYIVTGSVSVPALFGMGFSTLSCFMSILPDGTVGAGFMSKAAAVAGTAATVFALI